MLKHACMQIIQISYDLDMYYLIFYHSVSTTVIVENISSATAVIFIITIFFWKFLDQII